MRPAGVFHGDAHVPVVTDKIVGGSKLLGEMRDLIRRKHYSIHTKQAYLEFERSQIIVRNGKGTKDRVTLLPPALVPAIRDQMALAKQLHAKDLAAGLGEVYLPCALARKYPSAAREWGWQYLFPAGNTAVDPRSGKTRRHHLGESAVQRARRPSALPASTSTVAAIRYVTASQPIYWKTVTTSVRFRNCSVTAMFGPP